MERISTGTTVVEGNCASLVPPTWVSIVRAIQDDEIAAAGIALAHSFASDPLSHYLLDGHDMTGYSPEDKWRLHVALMTTVVASHTYQGVVTTIGSDYDGLAIWEPPGSDTDGWWTLFRSGMVRLYFQLSPEGRKRYYKEMLPLLHHTKLEVMRERDNNSYYLVYIGTKPSARGRGYATKLIRDMVRKADTENRAMYLESSSPENNSFYARFGFEVKKTISFDRGPVPVKLDIMVREPQPPKVANPSSPATSQSTSSVGS